MLDAARTTEDEKMMIDVDESVRLET